MANEMGGIFSPGDRRRHRSGQRRVPGQKRAGVLSGAERSDFPPVRADLLFSRHLDEPRREIILPDSHNLRQRPGQSHGRLNLSTQALLPAVLAYHRQFDRRRHRLAHPL